MKSIFRLFLHPELTHETGSPAALNNLYFIGPWYHAAPFFSGLGSIVLLFGVLFPQQIREDLVRAATSPHETAKSESLLSVASLLHKVVSSDWDYRQLQDEPFCCFKTQNHGTFLR